jgi:hypothetical protein
MYSRGESRVGDTGYLVMIRISEFKFKHISTCLRSTKQRAEVGGGSARKGDLGSRIS